MLSVVITARNDNYGGDFLRRIKAFVFRLASQSEKFKRPVELLIAEWNPPAENPLWAEVLDLPPTGEYFRLRIFTVPKEIHDSFGRKMPLLEYPGKNIGIQQAKGENLLVTNPDILFSDRMFLFMTGKLNKNEFYVAPRYDVDFADLNDDWSNYSEKVMIANAFRMALPSLNWVNFPSGRAAEVFCKWNIPPGKIPSIKQVCKDFVRAWLCKQRKKEYSRIFKALAFLRYVGHSLAQTMAVADYESPGATGAGDFTLSRRNNFISAGGYPEDFNLATHLDSVMCERMRRLKLKPRLILHRPIFHIAHDRWDQAVLNPEGIDWNQACDLEFSKSDSWGMQKVTLHETVLS